MVNLYKTTRERRQAKIRNKIRGNAKKPRFNVFRSNKYIYVQAIDDVKGVTITSFSSLKLDKKDLNKTKTEQAILVGENFGKLLIKKGINTGVFDRSSYRYHGRVKALADGIRKAGVKF